MKKLTPWVAAVVTLVVASVGIGSVHASDGGSPGAAYAWTNDPDANEIVVFDRAADGTLTPAGSFATGGRGSGMLENNANGVIVAGVNGEEGPNNFTGTRRFVITVNAGSDSISVFRIRPQGLQLVEVEPSQGQHPLSVTARKGVLYVLNGGQSNCMGGMPNISGFTLDGQGMLEPIPGSTRPVSGGSTSGCAQVSFNKTGDVLVVTERAADKISTYTVGRDGVAAGPIVNETTGVGPFGFTFTQRDQLITTENFGAAPAQGGAASYEVGDDGVLTPLGPTVRNGRSDTCWVVVTDNDKFAYITNFQSGDISLFRVTPQGTLVLVNPSEEFIGIGAADLSLSQNSRYLYARNANTGTVHAFAVDQTTGELTPIQVAAGVSPGGNALGGFASH
jgi:6-phosphogluconolactonase